jgi:SPP1 gp7 family putative phage head morphogenesis protein
MALTNNPNKTKTIEKKWRAEARRRFAELKKETLLIPLSSVVTNVTDSERIEIERFMVEFERLATALIITDPWQNKYQTQSYLRGLERTNNELKSLFKDSTSEFFGLIHAKSIVSLALPGNRNELDFLHERANASLDKWVVKLLDDTKSILHEQLGVVDVEDIFEAIADRINVTTTRSEAIAATEVAQASQRAVVKQAQEASILSDEQVDVRWITVRDSRVRHLHANWHGKIFSPEQAARNITISPFNCRCGLKPVIEDRVPARVEAKFIKERKFLLSNEKAQ